ncbi:hypothetical protein BHE74_00040450 [Ensete ventricosum]|nr:hypothetical protein GW17_00054002 [Ensete ventricosum]RWW53080.1 hypothetical protein BHE74_00040450 [Ensete ventricosum]
MPRGHGGEGRWPKSQGSKRKMGRREREKHRSKMAPSTRLLPLKHGQSRKGAIGERTRSGFAASGSLRRLQRIVDFL